jgi:hypothetical protein
LPNQLDIQALRGAYFAKIPYLHRLKIKPQSMKKGIIKSLGIFALVVGFQANSQEQNEETKTMDNILLAVRRSSCF